MSEIILTCGKCGALHEESDADCGKCGASLRFPVPASSTAVTPWRGAMPGLMQGIVIAGAGVALRYAGPKLAGFALRRALRRRGGPSGYVIETQITQRIRPIS